MCSSDLDAMRVARQVAATVLMPVERLVLVPRDALRGVFDYTQSSVTLANENRELRRSAVEQANAAVRQAQLEGLQNVNYQDAVLDQPRQQWVDVVTIAQELDRIYWETPRELLLREVGRKVRIIASQFEDTVVWNPGPEKCASLPDMPDEDWPQMLCVEAAQIGNPVRLSPGEEWAGMQTLVVED